MEAEVLKIFVTYNYIINLLQYLFCIYQLIFIKQNINIKFLLFQYK